MGKRDYRLAEIRDGKKQCRLCKQWIDINLFGTFLDKKKAWVAKRRYINSRCKRCAVRASSEWGKKNYDRIYQKWKVRKQNLLLEIRNHYGNKCACCGESNALFLTIDHINNDGYKLRPRNKNGIHSATEFSGHYYVRIIKQGFPKDLQLLCWNCNCGKQRNGGICPHKQEKIWQQ